MTAGRLTMRDIEDQINGDYSRFFDSIYDGELPENLIETFKHLLMKVPPSVHNLSSDGLSKLIEKGNKNEFRVVDVGIIINVIFSASYNEMYSNLEEAFEKHKVYEEIKRQHNKKVDDLEKSLKRKREHLMKLAGIGQQNHIIQKR
jgi:hypothetical protein